MTNRSASRKPSTSEKGKRPALNLLVEIETANHRTGDMEPKLIRAGALWAHENGPGFGGYFDDTGSGRRVRIVLFEPGEGEYDQGKKKPAFKVFIERNLGEKSDLVFAGLVWRNVKAEGMNGFILTNLLSGAEIRIACMPPVDRTQGDQAQDEQIEDDEGQDD